MAQKETILIVDDNTKNIQLLGKLLKQASYNFLIALDGENALNTVSKNSIDLILLDISMPGMDGYEVCEALKENDSTKDIPVIFMTARVQNDDIIKGFELGAVDYITKPFNTKELLQRLETHLKIKNQKDQLEEKNEKLIEMDASKNRFFSIISHDLRSPLSSLMGVTEYLNTNYDQINQEETKETLALMHSNVTSTFRLLENLLEWSKIQTGLLKFNSRAFNLKDLIENNIILFNQITKAKEIFIESDFDEDVIITADKDMINTVVRNLISNAIKFSQRGGLVLIKHKYDQGYITISIVDKGVGIKAESIDKLFKIDKKQITRGTENEKGTGLGLLLCKDFIDIHRGELSIFSELNKGTTVEFSLPIA